MVVPVQNRDFKTILSSIPLRYYISSKQTKIHLKLCNLQKNKSSIQFRQIRAFTGLLSSKSKRLQAPLGSTVSFESEPFSRAVLLIQPVLR